MDWMSKRSIGPVSGEGQYPYNEAEAVFEFLPAQGPGRRFNYVPTKLVVPAQCDARVEARLAEKGYTVEREFAGGRVYAGPRLPQAEFVDLVDEVNSLAEGDGGDTRVAPLHALAIQDHGDFGPAGPPSPAPPLGNTARTLTEGERLPGEGVKVGVLDTGIYRDHPWFTDHVDPASDDEDIRFDPETGHLMRAVGHGTFVAGVVLRCAPGATIFARKVVDSHGVTDDVALAEALEEVGPKVDILCLPLGGYTLNDRGPLSILTILDKLYATHPDLVVVSAAGNNARPEPFWPAADQRVIGVGALDENGERAGFSNYGDWVDTYAVGTNVHSAFVEWDKRDPSPSASGGHHHHDPEAAALALQMDSSVKHNEGPWATWSGTSFATPVVVGAIAAAMRPASGPAKTACKAAFDVARDPRLKRQTSAGSVTEHTFVIGPATGGSK